MSWGPRDGFIARCFLGLSGARFYDNDYGTWEVREKTVAVASTYRIAWRAMAATTGFRTLYPALLPSGAAHIHGIHSAGPIDSAHRISAGAFASSFLVDFFLRSTGIANLYGPVFDGLPLVADSALCKDVVEIYLRLNCLTEAYSPLWEEITGEPWSANIPLRNAEDRRAAQNDIDAIVAFSLGVSADELCMIYRTQFPVMRRYDQEDHFDANGRKVPKDILKLQNKLKEGEELTEEQRTWAHPQSEVTYIFDYPFRVLDRETDLREAYAKFQKGLLGF